MVRSKLGTWFTVAALAAIPAVAHAKSISDIAPPPATAPFAAWTAVQQWMPDGGNAGNPLSDYGYSSQAGSLAWADEMGDRLSALGHATVIVQCFDHLDEDPHVSALRWLLCSTDLKAYDAAKARAELAAAGIDKESADEVLAKIQDTIARATKLGAAVDEAAKDDPGLQQLRKLVDAAKAEWSTYAGAHKAEIERYLALKDAVRSGKTTNKAFAGCYEATQPAFAKLVKATAPSIPWDVGDDYLPGYMNYLERTTDGYITTVAWAACAWGAHESGAAPYGAAANRAGGSLRAGWRTIAVANLLDPALKVKFADRAFNLSSLRSGWEFGIKLPGINDNAQIENPHQGVVKALKADGDTTVVSFRSDKVEECLEWADTDKIAGINRNGDLRYEKVCKRRGMVASQTEDVEAPTRYLTGVKPGDSFAAVAKFPVVSWKGKKLTSLLGVPL